MLPQKQYDTVIRIVRRADIDLVNQLRHVTHAKLKALGVARDLDKAVESTPSGSDQIDMQSIFKWINAIENGHKRSVWQLIAIDATAVKRG